MSPPNHPVGVSLLILIALGFQSAGAVLHVRSAKAKKFAAHNWSSATLRSHLLRADAMLHPRIKALNLGMSSLNSTERDLTHVWGPSLNFSGRELSLKRSTVNNTRSSAQAFAATAAHAKEVSERRRKQRYRAHFSKASRRGARPLSYFFSKRSMTDSGKACTLPSTLAKDYMHGPGLMPKEDMQSLLNTVRNAPGAIDKGFLWLKYGDSDYLSMANMHAYSTEGDNLNSQSVREALRGMFFEEGLEGFHDRTYHALGTFFLCRENHRSLHEGVEQILSDHQTHHRSTDRKRYYDSFYFPVGIDTSPSTTGWVAALREGKRPVAVIGPEFHDTGLRNALNHVKYFQIPARGASDKDYERVAPQVIEWTLREHKNEAVVFTVAAGSIGKMIMVEVFKKTGGKDIFIDVGASLDAVAGHASRSFNSNWKDNCNSFKIWMTHEICTMHCLHYRKGVPCAGPESVNRPEDRRR